MYLKCYLKSNLTNVFEIKKLFIKMNLRVFCTNIVILNTFSIYKNVFSIFRFQIRLKDVFCQTLKKCFL